MLEEKKLIVKFLHCDKLQATAFQYFSIHTQKLEENYCCEYFQSIIFNCMDSYICEVWTTVKPILYLAIYFLAAQCIVSLNQDLFGAFAV